jgi:internalin A
MYSNFRKNIMIFRSTVFISTALFLTFSLAQSGARAEKAKSFLEWCNTYKTNPNPGTQKTVKDLIELAGSRGAKDCQSASKVLSNLTSYSFNAYGSDTTFGKSYTKDIKPLASLPKLKHLDIVNSNDISDLNLFPKLETLKIYLNDDSTVSSLSPLANLTNLKGLEIGPNRYVESRRDKSSLADISAVGNLKNLKYLAIRGTKTADISAIGKLKSLKSATLVGNNIQNIDPLGELKQLEILELGSNQISNVKSLSKLKKLKFLVMGQNPITDKTCPLFETVCNWKNSDSVLRIDALFSRGINP